MSRPTNQEIADWHKRLFRTALRVTGSYQDAADMTQQTFMKALASWDSFDRRSLPTTWLHRILMNCIADWARRNAVRASVPLNGSHLCIADPGEVSRLERLEADEELAFVRSAIEALTPAIRIAFVLTAFDGYSYKQAAEILAVPAGTVASRVHEAKARLRDVVRGRPCEA